MRSIEARLTEGLVTGLYGNSRRHAQTPRTEAYRVPFAGNTPG